MAEAKRKSIGLRLFSWLILAAALVAPVIFYFTREQEIAVTAVQLARGRVEETITAMASGTVKPRQNSMVAAGTVGKVQAIPVKEGDRVEAGAVLVELEHQELDAQVALAEANLRVGKSRLEQAKIAAGIYEEIAQTRVSQAGAQLKMAKQDFERIRALADRKAVSLSDMDKIAMVLRVAQETDNAAKASQGENRVRQEEIKSAEAAIEQLEAGVTLAREMRNKAYVHAPFAGIVAKVLVDVGETVGGGLSSGLGGGSLSGGGGGMGMGGAGMSMPSLGGGSTASPLALIELVEDREVYVKSPFDEANAAQIKAGQKARIGLDAYRGTDFVGRVSFISPTVTRNLDMSRTLDVDVSIEEGHDKFIPGMSADVIILADEKDDVLFVPGEALIREEEVYVIDQGRAVRRKVSVGIGNWQRREVLEGVREGETLITSVGIKELKDGVKVKIVESLD